MTMHLRALSDVDCQLARHGYRLQWGDQPEGWHVLHSHDWTDEGSPPVCLGWMPDHRIPHLPALLEEHGWPTRVAKPWTCPFHRIEEPDDE